jgi:PAS domain S-box-containing protein
MRGVGSRHDLERRIALQRHLTSALGNVSQLLAGPGSQPLKGMLKVVGEAAQAAVAYIVVFPPVAEALLQPASSRKGVFTQVWHVEGAAAEAQWLTQFDASDEPTLQVLTQAGGEPHSDETDARLTSGWAVPILAADDTLYAYLGFEYERQPRHLLLDEVQSLNMLRGLLASFFERKLAEAAWRESEQRWRLLVDRHPDPILITIHGVVQYANQAAIELLGAPSMVTVAERPLHDFISAELSGLLDQRQRELEDGATVGTIEHEIIALDGQHRIVESTAVRAIYGREEAVLTVWRDITRLRESEERYRTFIETISEAIGRFRLDAPVFNNASTSTQVDRMRRHARLEESNTVMADLLTSMGTPVVAGSTLAEYPLFDDARLLRTFVDNGYRLDKWRRAVRGADGRMRHVIINAVGAVQRERLTSLWWSCVEITERIDLETRMVEALEQQQDRIGRDLHDGVGQLLTAIRMMTSNMATADGLPDDLQRRAQRVAHFAGEASDRVVEIHRGLVPVSLYQSGLAVGLSSLVDAFEDVPEVACSFHYDGKTHVEDQEAALQLFRIAQEAVNNAMKHAEAGQVVIDLTSTEQAVILEVRDDGKGFDPALTPGHSLGLSSMRYRSHIIGAAFDIRSAPGEGATVRCVLPHATE